MRIPTTSNAAVKPLSFMLCVWLLACSFLASQAHAKASSDRTNGYGWLNQPMDLADARHLLGRTGFGATSAELMHMRRLSRIDAINAIVDSINVEPEINMPAWVDAPAPHYWTRRDLPIQQRQAFDRQRDQEIVELRRWWINNMLQTSSPQTERLVLFWHDHFATSYEGLNRRSLAVAKQNQLFREKGTGSYRALLKSIIRDPAMLLYLNNQSNQKGKPNENLARELLELFTLGEGNYDETTVKEAARALTGYGVSETRNFTFRIHGYRRDMQDKTLFGQTGPHDGDALIDLILDQPAAAEHLVKKFWHAFISDSAPDAEFVRIHAELFRDSDYDLLALYKAVISSEAFWSAENRLSIIKSPATLLIGTARSLEFPKQAWTQMPALHALLGMDLFAPPNVSGWDEGAAYVIPGRLLNRQLALQSLLASTKNTGSDEKMMMRVASGSMMMSTDVSMQAGDTRTAPLQVRVAGHFYEGAPQYKLSLLDKQKRLLWTSEVRELAFGYDTQSFGKMQNFNQLAWQDESFFPAADIVSKAKQLKVEFLNDAAGKSGDRNLFVDSVLFDGTRISSVAAQQQSACPPKNNRDAGRLYCAGTIRFDLRGQSQAITPRPEGYSASSINVLWGNRNKKNLNATIALANVQTPTQQFHTLSFSVNSRRDEDITLKIDSFGCWPDCFEQWPECAWVDTTSQEKSLVFPLTRRSDEQLQCHFDSLSATEQELIKSLMASLPLFVDTLSKQLQQDRYIRSVELWRDRMSSQQASFDDSAFLADAQQFTIDATYPAAIDRDTVLPEPQVAVANLQGLIRVIEQSELSLPELLIGGVPADVFPELSSIAFENASEDVTKIAEQQLNTVLSHPVYQVY